MSEEGFRCASCGHFIPMGKTPAKIWPTFCPVCGGKLTHEVPERVGLFRKLFSRTRRPIPQPHESATATKITREKEQEKTFQTAGESSMINVFDFYLEPLKFIENGQIVEGLKTATSESYYGQTVAPGSYNIIRCNISVEGFVVGATSVSLIRVTVSHPILAKDFFQCSKNPSECHKVGLSVDYLNPLSLSQNQRRQVANLLSQFCDFWLESATAEVKKFFGRAISKEDEALDICRMAGLAHKQMNLSKAKELYNKALSTFHGIGGARVSLGEIAIEEGDLRTALRMFYDELEHAKRPSKGVALLYAHEINTALGYNPAAFIDLEEFYKVREKICLPSYTIDKIRTAAGKRFDSTPQPTAPYTRASASPVPTRAPDEQYCGKCFKKVPKGNIVCPHCGYGRFV